MVEVGAALAAAGAQVAKHMQHLSHSTDALAFIANQAERAAVAAEQAAVHARQSARMDEVRAVAQARAQMIDMRRSCRSCSEPLYAWETFCKACGTDVDAEQGTGSYDAIG